MPGKKRIKPVFDLTNHRYGHLLVLSFDGFKSKKEGKREPFWLTKCNCGKFKSIRQSCLRQGVTKSCGCLLNNFRKNKLPAITTKRNSLPPGIAMFNNLYSNYKYRAENVLGIPFELTTDEFKELTSQNCFYCGCSPLLKFKKKKNHNGFYPYNGVDRIINELGYIGENVVTCCEICNKAKRDMGFDDFVKWIKRISDYALSINFNFESKDEGNPCKIISILEILGFNEDFTIGNALKCITRSRNQTSDKEIEDLKKAVWYLNRKIEQLQKDQNA